MKPNRGPLIGTLSGLLAIGMILAGYSCTTIPKLPEGQATLQGVSIHSTSDLMSLVTEGRLVPMDVNVSLYDIEQPLLWYYDLRAMLINRLMFREPHPGNENIGYLRMEDPLASFPISGDTVETDTFDTFFNVWQFPGEQGKHINLMVRSFETFPAGIFMPYFLLFDPGGNIIARQQHMAPVDAGPSNTVGVMVWLEDLILQESGTYYIMVFADNKNLGASEVVARLGAERLDYDTAFASEGWLCYSDAPGGVGMSLEPTLFYALDLLMEREDDQFVVTVDQGLGLRTNARTGKYELILWLY